MVCAAAWDDREVSMGAHLAVLSSSLDITAIATCLTVPQGPPVSGHAEQH